MQNLTTLALAFWRFGWCPQKAKWFTWPDHAPFVDDLLGLATINLPTKYEALSPATSKTRKGIQNVENGVVW